ncbi:hypothetical protein GCM10027610_014710 [Dactylosporangium cerinum]
MPSAWHHVERHANNRIEADRGQLKHRLDRCAAYAPNGPHRRSSLDAFMQNLRRGPYELRLDAPRGLRVAAAFTELAGAI